MFHSLFMEILIVANFANSNADGKIRSTVRWSSKDYLSSRHKFEMRSGEENPLAPPADMYKSIILLSVAPVCKEDRIIVVGASRGESLDIACRVEADPPAHNFRWKFNNSGETLEVAPARFSMEKSSGVSVLRYTPSTELDYGTLSCWADNLVGTQSRPCLFQLVAAGEYTLLNCSDT